MSLAQPDTNAASAEEQYQAALAAVTAPAFRTASARDKQEALWSFISRWPYEQLPSMHSTNMQLMRKLMSRAFLRKAFVQDDDVRPPRTKAFHAFGTAAKMRFVADGTHPFTGIFATGGVGFMRASLAVGMPNYSPAAAFKFLLDGPHPSENLLLHQSLDMQASRDFFRTGPHESHPDARDLSEYAHAAALEILALPDLQSNRAAASGSSRGRHEQRHRRRARDRPGAGVPVRGR